MSSVKNDYNKTLFLPNTSFSMRASLPLRELEMIDFWKKIELSRKLKIKREGSDDFVLHDGPPYANGPIHIGTAANKIIKDIINRSMRMEGFNINYTPGWDCHGLPIEWKIEQNYRKKGINKDDVPIEEFRKECREFAEKWVKVQMDSFKRLFILGDWDSPYLTMNYRSESIIVRELSKFLMDGSLYRGSKPVMWSPIEKTALAEAEIEYQDITSTSIYVKFPIKNTRIEELESTFVVIWTTTPWTIPANRAIAYNKDITYILYNIKKCSDKNMENINIIIAEELASEFFEKCNIYDTSIVRTFKGEKLEETICKHPFYREGFDHDVPLLKADFVGTDQGTGLVHVAPSHGEDDFMLGQKNGLTNDEIINNDGLYREDLPLMAGVHVFKADKLVIEALDNNSMLVGKEEYSHSYPHSWRSKKPVIYKATPQWFISMDRNNLRKKALNAINKTKWVPINSKNRINAMVENRPDWCLSRQRSWGVPITIFINKKTGEPLRDRKVMDKIIDAVEKHGSDIWLSKDPFLFLGKDRKKEDYEAVTDILDVWFDSGSTHAFVLEDTNKNWPADLYVEGTDQHRGWFQSSLLEACGTRGQAPYKAVLTHGFVLDGQGKKMSKSSGNVVSPEDIIKKSGSDILRLWVALTDYTEDMRIGNEILSNLNDYYRRIRNTLRFILGNMGDFRLTDRISYQELSEIDCWILARLAELEILRKKALNSYTFHYFYKSLFEFCSVDLSAFYFDIKKDTLYCDTKDSLKRRASKTVLNVLYDVLTSWLAPVLCFTMEEVWQVNKGKSDKESVHLKNMPDIPHEWLNKEILEKWTLIRNVRKVINSAIEDARKEKKIGSSLEANIKVLIRDEKLKSIIHSVEMSEICIVSKFEIIDKEPAVKNNQYIHKKDDNNLIILVRKSDNAKCMRCWKYLEEVGKNDNKELCNRCYQAI